MSESKSMQNKGDRNIELQITKMALGKGTKDSAAGEKGSRATAGESL
jgi:hypothetical protein